METKQLSKKKGMKKAAKSDATNSGASSKKAPKAKKAPKELTLGEAIIQENLLSSKSKPADIKTMYKILEEGLGELEENTIPKDIKMSFSLYYGRT